MTLTRKLRTLTRRESPTSNDILHLYSPITGKDHYVSLSDLLTGGDYPEWSSTAAANGDYDIGDGVTYGLRLWESLVNNNTAIPTEGANWTEVSAANPLAVSYETKKTIVNITAVQIKQLFTARLDLLPAPGANKFHKVQDLFWMNQYGTTPFDFVAQNLYMGYENIGKYIFDPTIFFNDTADTVWHWDGSLSGSVLNNFGTSIINKPLSMWAQTSNATVGDSTAKAIIYYKTIDLS